MTLQWRDDVGKYCVIPGRCVGDITFSSINIPHSWAAVPL